MKKVEIKVGSFSKAEAQIVQSEIRKSPDITGYSIRELLGLDQVFKAYDGKELIGACTNFDFGTNWTELSAFIVIGHHRGQGVGGTLFAAAYQNAKERRKNIYIVSRNPAMISIIKKYDIKIIRSFWRLPAAVIIETFLFAISWYRVKEFLRKLPMKKSGKYIFGIKMGS